MTLNLFPNILITDILFLSFFVFSNQENDKNTKENGRENRQEISQK